VSTQPLSWHLTQAGASETSTLEIILHFPVGITSCVKSRHLHGLLDICLDAPGLRKMKMGTKREVRAHASHNKEGLSMANTSTEDCHNSATGNGCPAVGKISSASL
jgi:hypothetical protein